MITRDWAFLATTLVSCAVAAVVATFQYAVYTSFLITGAIVPHGIAADFWIKGDTVECFDFPTAIGEDYRETLARYVPGAHYRRVAFGFVPWRSPTGRLGNVAIVGVDDAQVTDTGFMVDHSDLNRLDIGAAASSAIVGTIAYVTLHYEGAVDTLPMFLGAPYVLVSFETARHLLGADPSSVAYLAGNYTGHPPGDFDAIARDARARFPDIAMVTGPAFEASSSWYWHKKTGAGTAIFLGATLASLLTIILQTNGILRFVQRYNPDLLSLLGHGAAEGVILKIIGGVALCILVVTLVIALLVAPLAIWACKSVLPWVIFKPSDILAPLMVSLMSMTVAIVAARRALTAFGPEAVFRS
ncbi:MAG: hypothetical protein RL367_1964 [Pseudomonadota bacterium]